MAASMSHRLKTDDITWMNPLLISVIGLLILMVLIGLCVFQSISKIEQDLRLKAQRVLSEQVFAQLTIDTDGRELIISGTVLNTQQRNQAIQRISSIEGVEKISNTITIMPSISNNRVQTIVATEPTLETLSDNDNDVDTLPIDKQIAADNDLQTDPIKTSNIINRLCVTKAKNLLNQQLLLYKTGSAGLPPEARSQLTELMVILSECPNITIDIIGHTDSSGEEAMNQQLSQARAEAVLQFMLTKAPEGMRLFAIGVGASQPLTENNTAPSQALNRRVDLVFPEG